MRSLLFILVFFCFGTESQSQTAQLIQKLESLNQLLEKIETGKEVHEQSIAFEKENPYRVSFSRITTTVKNGKTKEVKSKFHIGFLDKNQVRIKTSKNEMQLLLGSGKNKLIENFEEEESKGYDDKFSILCDNVDNARAMDTLFEEIIPLANEIWEKENELPTDFDALFSFIKNKIGSIDYDNENRVEQTLSQNTNYSDRINFSIEKFDKKGSESKNEYDFSFGDLNPSKVRLEIKKQQVVLSVSSTGGLKYITATDEKDESEFTDKCDLFFETPEQAILTKRALEKFIPIAKKEVELRMPKSVSTEEAKQKFQFHLKKVEIKDKSIEQDLSFDGRQAILEITTDKDGKSIIDKRIFDFSDCSDNPDSDIDKSSMAISIKTGKSKKYVQVFENGEQENYDNEITFYAPDVETHRQMMALLPIILKESASKITTENLDWLSNEAGKINEINSDLSQTLEKVAADEPCKVQLKQTENKGKKEEELLSEFNLYDINPRSVEMEIKGKNVFIEAETVGKDEIIQQYKDNGKLSYQKTIQIPVRNIVVGKKFAASLRNLIEGCKQ